MATPLASTFAGLSLVILLLGTSCLATISFVVHQDRPGGSEQADMKLLAQTTIQAMINRRVVTRHTYVYVPFNRQSGSHARDHQTLQALSQDVRTRGARASTAGGRGQCHGALLGPILTALQRSSRNSMINVFTTTLESDASLLRTVLFLARSKSIQINFIISTECREKSVVMTIANATGGNVLRIVSSDRRRAVEYLRHSIVNHPSKRILWKEAEMQKGEMTYVYFSVENGTRSLVVSVSCDADTVPIVMLTPPNRRHFSSTQMRHMRSSVVAYRQMANPGTWMLRIKAKEQERCTTSITAKDAAPATTEPAAAATKKTTEPIVLEWATSVGAKAADVRKDMIEGKFNLLLLPTSYSKRVGSIEALNKRGQTLQLLYRQTQLSVRSDGSTATAYGYLMPPQSDITLRINGTSDGARFSQTVAAMLKQEPDVATMEVKVETVLPAATPPARPNFVNRPDRLPVRAETPLRESVARPGQEFLGAQAPRAETRAPGRRDGDMDSLLNVVSSMEKELDTLRRQLERVQAERREQDEECANNKRRVQQLERQSQS